MKDSLRRAALLFGAGAPTSVSELRRRPDLPILVSHASVLSGLRTSPSSEVKRGIRSARVCSISWRPSWSSPWSFWP